MSSSANRKAQVSLEFLALMGFMFLLFIVLVVILQHQSVRVLADNEQHAKEAIADVVTRELRYAYLAGPGFERTFDMPRTLLGKNYTIQIVSSVAPAPPASTLLVNITQSPGSTPVVVPLPSQVFTVSTGSGSLKARTNSLGDVYFYIPAWVEG